MVDGWHASLELQYGPIISLLNSYINTETDEKISAYNKSRLACIDDELDRLNTDKHEYYATILSILHGAIASESFENGDTVANNLLTLVTTHLQEMHPEMYKSYKVAIDLGLPMGHKNLPEV